MFVRPNFAIAAEAEAKAKFWVTVRPLMLPQVVGSA